MLTFLRKIRKSLIDSGSARKYFLYAIGEILLVMIGILLALQVNNWNEERKDKETLDTLFSNLTVSLQKDSLEIVRILDYMEGSIQAQELILKGNAQSLVQNLNTDSLNQLIGNAFNGVFSFYPKMSVYNQIISANLMEIIVSNELKEALIEYYDYKCNRYKVLDDVLDQKYHGSFMTFIADELKIGFFSQDSVDPQIFLKTFDGLQNECRKVYSTTFNHHTMLKALYTDVNNLLVLIRR